ncbi:MAG: hypothetical protein K2G45_04040 [Lachnospiraceae bacterium]|nr:hypothetical protein [Lachnospiraceae bacterium]
MAVKGVTDYTNTYVAGNTNGCRGNTQDYLNGLKAKYPNVNITVADFKNEKQEDNYMFGSSGGNNIVIASNIIEQMASDPATAEKYEKYIAEVPEAAKIIKDGIASYGGEMIACGTSIDKNGKVTYWSIGRSKDVTENHGTAYKEKVQKQIEEKRVKKKKEEALKKKKLEKEETLEKLLDKIKNRVSANEPAADMKIKETGKGEQVDLSV